MPLIVELSTLEQLWLKGPTLPDVPTEPWPDKWVLQDSKSLTADGRTAAAQYCRRSACRTHTDGESHYYSMPSTLATFDPATKTWSRTSDAEVNLSRILSPEDMLAVVSARDRDSLHSALASVCENPSNLKAVVKALTSHVLVLLGASARDHWHFSCRGDGRGSAGFSRRARAAGRGGMERARREEQHKERSRRGDHASRWRCAALGIVSRHFLFALFSVCAGHVPEMVTATHRDAFGLRGRLTVCRCACRNRGSNVCLM